MAERTITVRITRDGEVVAETHGLKGEECVKYLAVLEQMLDAKAVSTSYTPEYYEPASTAQALREDLGLGDP